MKNEIAWKHNQRYQKPPRGKERAEVRNTEKKPWNAIFTNIITELKRSFN